MRRYFLLLLYIAVHWFCVSDQGSVLAQIDSCAARTTEFSGAESVRADLANLEFLYELRWSEYSPSCRYLTGVFRTPENPNDQRLYIVWDFETGQRVIVTARPYSNNLTSMYQYQIIPNVNWHPDETEVVISSWWDIPHPGFSDTFGSRHLYKLDSGEHYELTCVDSCANGMFKNVFWDDERNWLWVSGKLGVVVYDRSNGAEIRTFRNPTWVSIWAKYQGHLWQFSPDKSLVIIYSHENSGYSDALTIYDIDRFIAYDINVEGYIPSAFQRPRACTGLTSFALTPDNRYLVMGYTTLRVWDIQNLPEAYEDRLPIYRHPGPDANIHCLRIVSDRVVETITDYGIERWHIETGQRIG